MALLSGRSVALGSSSTAYNPRYRHSCTRRAVRRSALDVQASFATTALTLAAALPASILVDDVLDRAIDRIGRVTNAQTENGTRMYVAQPASSERATPKGRPAVVLIHQIFGLQQREVGLCDDLAANGYVSIAPDTFGGQCSTWIPRALAIAYPRALKPGATWGVETVKDAVEWLKQQPGVDPERIAVAGFCYGGGSALRYAAGHPGGAAAVGVFYGRPLTQAVGGAEGVEPGPLYQPLAGVPVFGVFGGRDTQFPQPVVDAFEAGMLAAGVPNEVRRYPSQGHAFISDVVDTKQAGSDAADAWAAFLAFLERNL